jgi:hypothetical protein
LRSRKCVRTWHFPVRAYYEDFWLQKVGLKERPYSISWIYFDRSGWDWVYRGLGFDKNFGWEAQWESRSIHYDSHTHRWVFYGNADLVKQGVSLEGVITVLHLRLPNDENIAVIWGRVADIGVERDEKIGLERDKKIIGRVFEIQLRRASVSDLHQPSKLYPESWTGRRLLPSFEQIRGMPETARADEVKKLFDQLDFLQPGDLRSLNIIELPREEAKADEERAI